jgi:hypothetical protein
LAEDDIALLSSSSDDEDDDDDADGDNHIADDAAADSRSHGAAVTLDPLSGTATGHHVAAQQRLYDGMSTADGVGGGSAAAANDSSDIAGSNVDETFGVDLAAPGVHLGLALRFFGLIKLRILPFAQKLDADSFRASYKTAAVSRCFRRHGPQLRRLFFRYATLHSVAVSSVDGLRADSWTNTIDLSEFVSLLTHLHLMQSHKGMALGGKEASKMLMTFEQVYAIFANVQQDLHVTNAAVTSAAVVKAAPWGSAAAAAGTSAAVTGAGLTAATASSDNSKAKLTRAATVQARRKTGSKGSQGSLSFVGATSSKKAKDSKRRASLGPGAPAAAVLASASALATASVPSPLPDATEDEVPSQSEAAESHDAHDAVDGGPNASGETQADALRVRDFRTPTPTSTLDAGSAGTDGGAATSVAEEGEDDEGEEEEGAEDKKTCDLSPPKLDPLNTAEEYFLGFEESSASAMESLAATHPGAHTELIFPEYLEALAAIALFRYPNPYRSTAERIAAFLEQDVLPHIPRLLRRTQHAGAQEEE